MKKTLVITDLMRRYPELSVLEVEIVKAAECLIKCFSTGRKLLVCGNGGSSSDSGHIASELLKGFEHKRPLTDTFANQLNAMGERGRYIASKLQQGFPVISLDTHTSLLTAVANDIDPDLIFAQQVGVYGNKGDVLIGMSTSGNSKNIIDAIITASAKEMTVIGMTGETGGEIKEKCDILINVPETRTFMVQELHLPVYHAICLMVENHFFRS